MKGYLKLEYKMSVFMEVNLHNRYFLSLCVIWPNKISFEITELHMNQLCSRVSLTRATIVELLFYFDFIS